MLKVDPQKLFIRPSVGAITREGFNGLGRKTHRGPVPSGHGSQSEDRKTRRHQRW